MTWDPEVDDLAEARRRLEREPSDVGSDLGREFGDEPAPAWRDAAPDPLAPIDPDAPVSGHVPVREAQQSIMDTPEHDWAHAAGVIYPQLRPVGLKGLRVDEIDPDTLVAQTGRGHTAPLIDDGPGGLSVVFAIHAGGFDIIVNGEHLLSWGVQAATVQEAARRNLAEWSARAPWTDEASGERRLVSSDTGEGWDAARVLLPEVLDHLARELGGSGRVLVAVPERHLLVAGALHPGDEEFGQLFSDFVAEQSGGADEPIDSRVFELVDGRLVEFAAAPPA